MVNCITENKKPMNVTYPRWLGRIFSRKEGYVNIHGINIPIPTLSTKIINAGPSKEDDGNDDASNKEDNDDEDDDNDDAGDEEDNDGDPKVGNKEGADEEEDTNKDEEESVVDMGKDFTQKINSPRRMNKNTCFESSSSSSDDDVA
ncbi:unnamed protein product [Lactuca saligna]|uniref:Uncharacterized protein n=1 Tax=Lactuca saligna TaxID=75948 RepID=A0AA35ZYG4_LACSI|nr:unnamed protein product [Lactuca saligna]